MKKNQRFQHGYFVLFLFFLCCSKELQAETRINQQESNALPKGVVSWITPSEKYAKTKIIRQRADDLLAKLPTEDPWEKMPDGSTLAWRESATLRALVDLYEATDDSKYLAEVAFRGDRLLSHRDDRRGVVDGSGQSRPAWSMAFKYVVAKGSLADASGNPVIDLRSTPSAYNHLTTVEVIPTGNGNTNRFSLYVTNSHFNRRETFSDLSLNPADERFVEKVVNDPMAPYSAKPGTYTQNSNLIRVKAVAKSSPIPETQAVTLEPIPLAYMGYIGVIYDPMLRFAEIVKGNPALADLVPAANRFILAAEESYADASKRLWRTGPNKGEGYYLTCEKGESFPADNVGQPFNFLGRHVCVQLALYRLTGKKVYLERSERMVQLFKNRLKYDSAQDLYVWNYWYEPMTTTGWSPKDNLSFNVRYFHPAPNVEDVSHGVLDIAMVVAANRAGIGFNNTDVRRFANTLLINVLMPDRTGVRRRVDGQGEYPAYFRALHGWLELSEANREVYQSIRQAYEKWDEDDLAFCANLLKWEKKLLYDK